MITLTFANVQDPSFGSGLTKLANHAGFSPSVALSVGQTVKAIENFHRSKVESHQKLASEYGEKQADGTLKQSEEVPGTFVIQKGKEKEFDEKMRELRETKSELKVAPIPFRHLDSVGLSPSEIYALDFIFNHEADLKQVK